MGRSLIQPEDLRSGIDPNLLGSGWVNNTNFTTLSGSLVNLSDVLYDKCLYAHQVTAISTTLLHLSLGGPTLAGAAVQDNGPSRFYIKYTTTGASGNGALLSGGTNICFGYNPVISIGIKTGTGILHTRQYYGAMNNGSVTGTDSPTSYNMIAFFYSKTLSANQFWRLMYNNGNGSPVSVETTYPIAENTEYDFLINVRNTGWADCYINQTYVGSVTGAEFPNATALVAPVTVCANLQEGAAKSYSLNHFRFYI